MNAVAAKSPTMPTDRAAILEEEALIIRYGGEISEIAFHSTLHYLCHDPEGPTMVLQEADLPPLRQAVVELYHEIIRRDLEPDNRDKPIFRGLARVIANWYRLQQFLIRQKVPADPIFHAEIAACCTRFIEKEFADVNAGLRQSCINCSAEEWTRFIRESFGSDPDDLPSDWQRLCRC